VSTPATTPELGDSGGLPPEDTGAPIGSDGAAPDTSPAPDAGHDATVTPPTDSGVDSAAAPVPDGGDAGPLADAADAAIPTSKVRFGNFSSATGLPALDLCVSPHGTFAWQGPLLGNAGLAAGLAQLQVSSYFTVPSGLVDVRVLYAGSTCDSDAGVGDFDVHTPIPAGSSITIAIADTAGGDAGPGPALVPLLDEPPNGTMANLRMVNLAPLFTTPVTLDLGSGVAAQAEFSNVTAAQMLDPTADALGYKLVGPTTLDMTLQNAESPIVLPGITLAAGGLVTSFVAETNSDGPQYAAVTCLDGVASASSAALTQCTSTFNSANIPSYTRFANFIADTAAPSAAVCIRYHGLSTFQGPIIGGPLPDASSGGGPTLSPPSGQGSQTTLSGYFEVASGFQYDVRFIAGGSSDCTTSITPTDALYTSPASGNATVAATGFITLPSDAGEPGMFDAGPPDAGPDGAASAGLPNVNFAWVTLVDDNGASAAARVVHFASLTPQPLSVSAGQWTLTDIPYGAFGTQATVSSSASVVGPNGYLTVPSGGGSFSVTDTITGNNLAPDSFGLAGSNTFFLYAPGPFSSVGVLQCVDSTEVFGGVWACNVLGGG
jgi:hypothetical protein